MQGSIGDVQDDSILLLSVQLAFRRADVLASVPFTTCFSLFFCSCRMALALARALSGGSSMRQEERHRVCAGPLPRRGNRRGEVARSLMAFALRLDVIVVSAASAMLLVLLSLLARLLL